MDTSTRLAFVLGELDVKASDIKPSEWFQILGRALGICKPYLKYLSGFEEILKCLNTCSHDNFDSRETDLAIVQFQGKLDGHTRCLNLARLCCEIKSHNLTEDTCQVIINHLLLTQEGQWVHWYAKYNRITEHGFGYNKNLSATREIAVSSSFIQLDDIELQAILEKIPQITPEILRALHQALQQSVEEKRGRIRTLEEKEAELRGLVVRAGC